VVCEIQNEPILGTMLEAQIKKHGRKVTLKLQTDGSKVSKKKKKRHNIEVFVFTV
jgi:hypothetical protein